MCGIAGIYGAEGAPGIEVLRAMASRLGHRGPDHDAACVVDYVGLAHTRLSVVDLAGGAQPLYADDGRLVLIANGEIYNHIELRAELEARGRVFATRSDCEAILHAYAAFGDAFLDRLCGMFAFALYDRTRRRLVLARDRMGIKPLFLARHKSGYAFASELKAFTPLLGKPQVNPVGLVQYLQSQFNTAGETIWAGVERVLPGEMIALEDGCMTRRIYWNARETSPQATSYRSAAERFEALFDLVVRQHMRADVPFGLFLSGGLDSSILLAMLSRHKSGPIRTFSVGFDDARRGTELDLAQALARHYGAEHTVLRPTGEEMLQRLPACVWAADDLMRDFANMPTLLLAEAAGRELKVVFSGEGGDEVFGGYGRYRAAPTERWLKRLFFPGSGGFRVSGNFRGGLARQVFGPALLDAIHDWRRPFIEAWQACPRTWSDLQRMQYVDLTTALPDNLLVKADRMLMAHGVEGRVPMLDHRVVEFGLSLPDELKISGREGKIFLRRWSEPLLPGDHLQAPKRGFNVPVDAWLRGNALDRLEHALAEAAGLRDWIRPRAIHHLAQLQRRGHNVTKNLSALLQFAVWQKIFVEGDGSRPPLQDPVAFIS